MNKLAYGKKMSLYQQMAHSLKKRIRAGEYRAGRTLPSLRALSREFGVSLSVAQRALRHLESKGVVLAQHGRDVQLVDTSTCRRAALSFGFIHPYSWEWSFENFIHSTIDQAFAERDNFLITRSSLDDPKQERDIAEHLIDNGVQGMVLWACDDDPNESYFLELAKRIPVVLLDRVFRGGQLPSVVLDYRSAGHDICRVLLEEQKRKRLLVLSDNLHISSFEEMTEGIQDQAVTLGRPGDVTLVKFPISKIIDDIFNRDWSLVDQCAPQVERLLKEDGYDAVCCTQGQFLDYVIAETGLADQFPELLYATLTTGRNTGSRKYNRLNVVNWLCDYRKALSTVAEMVQDRVLNKRVSKTRVRIPIQQVQCNAVGSK
ncbi:MAG: GntR family transcriptional regulator [Phycisphaerae bacterium]|nr:GntR family transcriptional regulator [Phycisphaerae bacterium]